MITHNTIPYDHDFSNIFSNIFYFTKELVQEDQGFVLCSIKIQINIKQSATFVFSFAQKNGILLSHSDKLLQKQIVLRGVLYKKSLYLYIGKLIYSNWTRVHLLKHNFSYSANIKYFVHFAYFQSKLDVHFKSPNSKNMSSPVEMLVK